MAETPRISVVLLYNGERYLRKSIESVLVVDQYEALYATTLNGACP